MNIAFIRGPFLNPWELQTYSSIAKHHTFRAIGGDWQFYNKPIDIPGITIQKAHIWGKLFSHISPSVAALYNRAWSWTSGRSYGLSNLEALVSGADILHPAELFFTMTSQCVELKRQRGYKLAVTVWENLPGAGERHPWRKRMKQQAISAADGILAVTESTRHMLIGEGVPQERIAVIPMAVDTRRFFPNIKNKSLLERLKIPENATVVLFIGRLVEEKGVRELLDAAIRTSGRTAVSPIRFCIVGDGPLRYMVEDAASRMQNLVYCPFMPYSDLPDLHNLADVFVLPSKPAAQWQEQFGYVLVESMASGKPVISTQTGSIPDVVGDAAVLIPPGNAEALAQAIVSLADDPIKRGNLGKRALDRVQSTFSVEAITPLLETFYSNIQEGIPVGTIAP